MLNLYFLLPVIPGKIFTTNQLEIMVLRTKLNKNTIVSPIKNTMPHGQL